MSLSLRGISSLVLTCFQCTFWCWSVAKELMPIPKPRPYRLRRARHKALHMERLWEAVVTWCQVFMHQAKAQNCLPATQQKPPYWDKSSAQELVDHAISPLTGGTRRRTWLSDNLGCHILMPATSHLEMRRNGMWWFLDGNMVSVRGRKDFDWHQHVQHVSLVLSTSVLETNHHCGRSQSLASALKGLVWHRPLCSDRPKRQLCHLSVPEVALSNERSHIHAYTCHGLSVTYSESCTVCTWSCYVASDGNCQLSSGHWATILEYTSLRQLVSYSTAVVLQFGSLCKQLNEREITHRTAFLFFSPIAVHIFQSWAKQLKMTRII